MSVLRDWIDKRCTMQMQGTLLTAIRGPDNEAKESPSKPVVRALRCVLLQNARGFVAGDTFMGDGTGIIPVGAYRNFFKSIDQYPFHWFMHFIHSAEIVGYKHPNPDIRKHWLGFYNKACDALHVNPETEDQLDERLAANGATATHTDPCPLCGGHSIFMTAASIPLHRAKCSSCLAHRYYRSTHAIG